MTISERDALVSSLLKNARRVGQIGSDTTSENRDKLLAIAKDLSKHSDAAPARVPLTDTHNLLYSASPGGSSGKIGPFVGRVTQYFPDETTFFNEVAFGPVKISLRATREVLDDYRIRVTFRETTVTLFNAELVKKEVTGRGVWKQLFVGIVKEEEGAGRKLLRVFETPSLFIVEQPLEDQA
eukprot:CAMPEP_0172516498 /NCGR_PEP_ID=MMETSP1066-20121228/276730_1 /TAXON_ID=671091 /ORGANISM="Coscinodiscus wailesii, Strain CCMP2513" /LENGTH=181 /DNA_ID=CAMNT_0013298011 /DNA_START=345 /DNA_END=890 /DNA_ORIENTATION=-